MTKVAHIRYLHAHVVKFWKPPRHAGGSFLVRHVILSMQNPFNSKYIVETGKNYFCYRPAKWRKNKSCQANFGSKEQTSPIIPTQVITPLVTTTEVAYTCCFQKTFFMTLLYKCLFQDQWNSWANHFFPLLNFSINAPVTSFHSKHPSYRKPNWSPEIIL